MKWSDANKSTQLHEALLLSCARSNASASRPTLFRLATDTAAKLGRLVFNTCLARGRQFTPQTRTAVHFSSCAGNEPWLSERSACGSGLVDFWVGTRWKVETRFRLCHVFICLFVCVEQMTVVTSRAFSGVWQSKVVFSNSTDKYNRFRLDFSRPRLSSTLAYWRLPLTFVQSFRKCDRTLLWMSGFEWGLVTVPFVRVRVRVSFIVIKAGFLNAEFGSLCKIMFKHLLVAT